MLGWGLAVSDLDGNFLSYCSRRNTDAFDKDKLCETFNTNVFELAVNNVKQRLRQDATSASDGRDFCRQAVHITMYRSHAHRHPSINGQSCWRLHRLSFKLGSVSRRVDGR